MLGSFLRGLRATLWWWLTPLLVILALAVLLAIVGEGSSSGPFLYSKH